MSRVWVDHPSYDKAKAKGWRGGIKIELDHNLTLVGVNSAIQLIARAKSVLRLAIADIQLRGHRAQETPPCELVEISFEVFFIQTYFNLGVSQQVCIRAPSLDIELK